MIYDLLAPVYDRINSDIDYVRWADFIEAVIARNYTLGRPELLLDLGCGTGRMTLELAERGYDMTGVDYSPEMLDIARKAEAARKPAKPVLWLCQDMCDFELYGTVDVAVCCLDGINHITSEKSLGRCFDLVHNYLVPDGLFIFDINGKHKFESIYGNETYVMEEDDSFCIWQNDYDPKRRICDFYITLFKECEGGRYARFDEMQSERMYTLRRMKKMLLSSNFELLGAYSDFDFNPADDNSERIYIAARCIKK